MNTHETYIRRCLQIAKNGLGSTRPNPMVGAVVVHENKIIGEGFTSEYGGPHSEVNAIKSVKNKALLKESTLYVTLEPCSHYGKTPPCSDLIISNRIQQVVIGCIDDNPQVAGKGVAKLKNAGVDVIMSVLEADCKMHHKRFFTFHNKKRPYIILKWAETKDGFVAPLERNDQKPVWITNTYSRQMVHKWRAEEQAILVGTNTVLQDNPSLTVRDWNGNNPIRIVLDRNSKLKHNYSVFDDKAKTIVINDLPAEQICKKLYELNINSIIIEGGTQTLQTFINGNLWDEARIFTGSSEFKSGIKAPNFKGTLFSESEILNDSLRIYFND